MGAVRPAICCISVKKYLKKKEKFLYSNWFSKHLFVHFSKSLEDRNHGQLGRKNKRYRIKTTFSLFGLMGEAKCGWDRFCYNCDYFSQRSRLIFVQNLQDR